MPSKSELDRRVYIDIIDANGKATQALGTLSPVWACFVAYALSGPIPSLGVTPLSVSVWWIVLCACAALFRIVADIFYARAKRSPERLRVRFWLVVFASSSSFVTATWSSSFWFFYEEGNAANLYFLMALMVASITQATVIRSNHFPGACAVILPAVILPVARLIVANDPAAFVPIYIYPAWVGVVLLHVRRTSKDIVKTYRMRYEMEEMASHLEEARDEALRQRALAEQSNASKSAFLANMSHELRTPLNAILGFSEIISTDALGQGHREKYRGYAADILASGRHLLALINGLLDIAKIEAGRMELSPEWIDASYTVEECMRLVERQADATGVRLFCEIPDGAMIYADEQAFRQVLLNLLSNAVKFTPAGGDVHIRIESCGERYVLEVRDSGIGIPEEAVERLFRPFEQLENDYGKTRGGTGLGLALVKALAELHGGTCELESRLGEGTTVRISFPVARTRSRPRPSALGRAHA